MRSLVAKPRRGIVQRANLFQRKLRAATVNSSMVQPLANAAAAMLPALIPARASMANLIFDENLQDSDMSNATRESAT